MRVRHHAEIARIELPGGELKAALALRAQVVTSLKLLGYTAPFVASSILFCLAGTLFLTHYLRKGPLSRDHTAAVAA